MKAVAYCRYSSDNQRYESIQAQLEAIKDFCKKEDITLIDTYIDEALSATKDDRKRFIDMIKDSEKGYFDSIIVHKLDRFSRNKYDSVFYKKKLKDNGVTLLSVLERFDNSPESVILESVLEGMAEYYSLNLAREVKKGFKQNVIQGLTIGGTPPLGYDLDNKKYVINKYEASVVKLIYDLYLKNYGYTTLVHYLVDHGYKTKAGKNFNSESIRKILSNEKYIGNYKYDNEVYKNLIPIIINENVFYEVQKKRKSKTPKPINRRKNNNYLLTGLMTCGKCGHSYIGCGYNKLVSGIAYKYQCTRRHKDSRYCDNNLVYKDEIESVVIEFIKENLLTDNAIERISDKMLSILDNIEDDKDFIKELNDKKLRLENQLNKILDLYIDGEIDKKMIAPKMEAIKENLCCVENDLIKCEKNHYSNNITKANVMQYLTRCRTNLESTSFDLKRQVVESFIDEIIINETNVNIKVKVSGTNIKKTLTNNKGVYSSDTVCHPEAVYTLSLDIKRQGTKLLFKA